MEEQILSEIINPIENYETVRYIHKPYTSSLGVEQTDIWFSFYFLNSGSTYVNDYEPTGLSNRENALMLKQTVKSFFRLEFFKTPNGVKPDRTNRKLVFAKNLSLPLGEKYFHTDFNDYIFLPVFMGSNYRNKENMYLFWFQDESPFSGTTITGNTFWMTAKFYNAEDGSISDFVNKPNFTDVVSDGRIGKSGNPIKFYEKNSLSGYTEYEDLYYKVTIDKSDYSYMVERDVQNDITLTPTPTPATPTPTPTTGGGGATNTPTPTGTPTPTPTVTVTPTPTITPTPTPECVISVGFEVDSAGDVRYIDCCGTTVYETFGIGPQVINDCLQYGSLFQVGATISFINYSASSCSCEAPTPLTFTATVDNTQYGEQPPNNVVTVTVESSSSAVGTYLWWGKKSGTATTAEFTNLNTAMLITASTGHTFELVIDDDETTETDQTFSVAIFTGSSTNAGGEVAYTSTFTILDDSIAPQYRYAILERIKDYNGGPCDLAGNNLTNYYWDQINDGILDGSDQLWSGAGYCYRVVSFTNDTNELGNTQISDASKNNCPSC